MDWYQLIDLYCVFEFINAYKRILWIPIFNLPACSLFQLSGRKVNILPSYVIFHFVNVDIPRLCDISFFFFLLEFLKYISQHCTIQDLTSDNAKKTYIYCLLYCFSKKETFDVFWYGGMPSWQNLGTFLKNWSYKNCLE